MAIAQSKEKPQEITKVDNYDICSGYIPGRPEDKTAGIILCKDSRGNRIYEVSHAAKMRARHILIPVKILSLIVVWTRKILIRENAGIFLNIPAIGQKTCG